MNKKLAIDIYRAEIPVFEESKFKFNEEDPEAPRSLMKLNLRRYPEGKLTNKLIEEITREFVKTIRGKKIKFDLVVGLPRAGEPFAEKFVEVWNKEYSDKKKIIYLEKGVIAGKRRILEKIKGEFSAGDIVLMIDDVISLAHSKVEAAKALRKNGLIVTHCSVLMDWELGGVSILKNNGIEIIRECTATEFLKIWKGACLIAKKKIDDIIKRRDEIKDYNEKRRASA
ncbi:MAG: phosphoribosyltransferase [Candidatus Paceibacterota bacterium]|jgi:orotate phosphoribosyltransferase